MRYLFLPVGAAIGLLLAAGRGFAADYYVATNGSDTGTHDRWSYAYTNIQDALNTATNGDTIYLAGHTFALTTQLVWSARTNVTIRGGFAASNDLDVPGVYDPQQWPARITRASGNIRLMLIGGVSDSRLEGVVFTGGSIPYPGSGVGGGLYISTSTNLSISDCMITNNSVGDSGAANGGGLYLSGSSVTLSNCVISGNTAAGGGNGTANGGGIAVISGTLRIMDSVISVNLCSGVYSELGGAIYNAGTLIMSNCLVRGNSAAHGISGALYSSGTLRIHNSTVAYNHGGGVNGAGGTAAATNSIFWRNGMDVIGAVSLGYNDIQSGVSNGVNGNISADPVFEWNYYLATNSPCIGAGTNPASAWNLDGYTTRTNGAPDSGARVDLGYHRRSGCSVADIYVATNGDNSNSGASWEQAFRSITRALVAAREGTRIHVGAGQFTNVLETFPLALGSRVAVQLIGTNSAETVINAQGSGRVMDMARSGQIRIEGVTITRGNKSGTLGSGYAGGVYIGVCDGIVFADCIMTNNSCSDNSSANGGAIYMTGSSVMLSNCVVGANTAVGGGNGTANGGGIVQIAGSLSAVNTVFAANYCSGVYSELGGALYNSAGSLALRNCLLVWNRVAHGISSALYSTGNLLLENCTVAYNSGGGIFNSGGAAAATNAIFWGNGADTMGNVLLNCCDLQGGLSNGINGCFTIDPLFVDTNYFHLQSRQGCYTNGYFGGGGWTGWSASATNSPAIDAGDPASDFSLEPVPGGGRINLGAYGNTPVASLTDTTTVFTAAVVTNLGAAMIGHRTARLNGQITDDGDQVPACGFAYWATGSGSTSTVPVGLQNAAFFTDITGLAPGTSYQYSAYATNSAAIVWSDVKTFDTHPVPDTFHVATNGDNTDGVNWSRGLTNLQTVLNIIESGDTICLAGQVFAAAPGYLQSSLWTWQAVSNVTMRGGYAATNDAGLPGSNNPTLWPTILRRTSGSARLLQISGVNASLLEGITFTGGSIPYPGTGQGGGIKISNCTNLTISGCTITNNAVGDNSMGTGGGLHLTGGSVTISNCIVGWNSAAGGGNGNATGAGVALISGALTAVNSVFIANSCSGVYWELGGALYNSAGTMVLRNCLLAWNRVSHGISGALYSTGTLKLQNCTLAYNSGGGLNNTGGAAPVTNSIFWANGDDLTGAVAIAYCNIQSADTFWTNGVNGCISVDPLFVDTNYFHLQSRSGQYAGGYFSGGSWANGLSNSPCIDMGDPYGDYSLEPQPNGRYVNMGYDGNTPVASKSALKGAIFFVF